MPIPPPISPASVERLGRAAECADSMVDDGVAPARALAKAARDEALPYGHVPVLVRAFNTGRAARQLAETDPWRKAADHPVTTADAVYAALTEMDEPKPTKSAAEYTRPPQYAAPEPVEEPFRLSVVPGLTKAASAPKPSFVDRRVTIEFETAKAVDAIRDAVAPVSPAVYGGIKAAVEHVCPTASDVFRYIEERNPFIAVKAASDARPDPTVSASHPVVALARTLVGLRESYVAPTFDVPPGYVKIAEDCDRVWYQKDENATIAKQAVDGVLDVTLPEPTKSAADDPGAAPGTGPSPFGRISNYRSGVSDFYAPKTPAPTSTGGSAIGRGFHSALSGALGAAADNALGRNLIPAVDIGARGDPNDPKSTRSPDYKDPRIDPTTQKLKADMSRIDEQSALQDVIADPRLARADPKTVIETYQTLSKLAPEAMRNPSIAADFIHRRIHTGPPSLFDLNQLVTLEKSLAQIGEYRAKRDAADSNDD